MQPVTGNPFEFVETARICARIASGIDSVAPLA